MNIDKLASLLHELFVMLRDDTLVIHPSSGEMCDVGFCCTRVESEVRFRTLPSVSNIRAWLADVFLPIAGERDGPHHKLHDDDRGYVRLIDDSVRIGLWHRQGRWFLTCEALDLNEGLVRQWAKTGRSGGMLALNHMTKHDWYGAAVCGDYRPYGMVERSSFFTS